MSIIGNMAGCYSPMGKTFIIEDEDGNEFTGVLTDKLTVFDATPADVKIGKTFVSDEGVSEGTDTRTYRTTHANCLIFPGESFSIPLDKYNQYDYTQFQAMISVFNTTVLDSVSIEKISIYDSVFNVNSSDVISNVTKNSLSKSIDLNFTNNTDSVYIINYNTYKEE